MIKMRKTYTEWMRRKRNINNHGVRIKQYREGNIYWAYIGENVGMEQDGNKKFFTRPVLVLKGLAFSLFICVPISSKNKNGPFYMPIQTENIHGVLLLNQIRVMDTLRLGDLLDVLPRRKLRKIKRKTARLIRK